MSEAVPGGMRGMWHRLTRTQEQAEAEELQRRVRLASSEGIEAIAECEVGGSVTISGVVNTVTLRPRASIPALEVDLYDGSGHVHVVWLGRRMIPGIDAGRSMIVHGRLTNPDGRRTIYNPRYELLPKAG